LPFQEAFKFSASESKTVNYGFIYEIDAFRKNTWQVVRKTLVTADLAVFRGMTACFFGISKALGQYPSHRVFVWR